jgi:hypothetical protein
MTLLQLRPWAKKLGIKGYSRIKRADLRALVAKVYNGDDATDPAPAADEEEHVDEEEPAGAAAAAAAGSASSADVVLEEI